jgi:ribose transport system permease protein
LGAEKSQTNGLAAAREAPSDSPLSGSGFSREVGELRSGVAGVRRRGFFRLSQEQVVLIVVAALVVFFGATLPGFLTLGNLLTLLRNVSVLGVLSLAMGLVVIARGIDLSLIATMGVSTALTLQALSEPGASVMLAVAIGVSVCIAMGLLNGFVIAFVEIPALFTTLATGLAVFGLARTFFLSGGNLIVDVPERGAFVRAMGLGHILGLPVPVLIFAGVCMATHFVLTRTVLGRFIYAHGDNPEAASLTGIPIRPLTMIEYTVCALLGYLAGLVLAGTLNAMDTQVIMTSPLIYNVLTVVVLGGISLVGGRGGVQSVVAGTLLIGVMLNGMTLLNMDVFVQQIIQGLILLAALVLDKRLNPRDEETVKQGD